jgi:glycosyltransferase involved in cell wall biosynthesis
MRILWLNWKDLDHPLAGGAEVVTEEIICRLARDGHAVTLFTSSFPGAEPEEVRHKDGISYRILRRGHRFNVYWHAWRFFRTQKKSSWDYVVDEVNTVPFFARAYANGKVVLFIHQLAREVWFYEMPFFISWVGYLMEPLYLRLLRKTPTITVSESTKRDLERHGYRNVSIISEGITVPPVHDLRETEKSAHPTMLTLGALRSMKRTLDVIKAFEVAKRRLPDLELVIAGMATGEYGERVIDAVAHSPYSMFIHYVGRVDEEKKRELMQSSQVLVVTSVKEGWCLTVTEANSQGTPAVVYNVDGLRDSVKDNETGLITPQNSPAALADTIVSMLSDHERYERMRRRAWEWSKEINFERSYQDFLGALNHGQ